MSLVDAGVIAMEVMVEESADQAEGPNSGNTATQEEQDPQVEVVVVEQDEQETPQLPAELVLKIAELLPAKRIAFMARACKAWLSLLLPLAVSRFMPTLVGYGSPFATLEAMQTFVQDTLDADKFRLVKSIRLWETTYASRALTSKLVEACTNLTLLSITSGGGANGKAIAMQLSEADLPSLETLSISFGRGMGDLSTPKLGENGQVEEMIPYSIKMPKLNSLSIGGSFNGDLVHAFNEMSCPLLEDITCNFLWQEGYDRWEVFDELPVHFLSKVTSWSAGDPDLLRDLLEHYPAEFKPTTITQEESGEYKYLLDCENPMATWNLLVKLPTLKHLYLFGAGTRMLFAGLPPNLETLSLQTVLPNLTNLTDFPTALSNLTASTATTVYIDIFAESDPPPHTPDSLRRWASELLLWAGVTGNKVTIEGLTGDEAARVARRTAEFVEEAMGGGNVVAGNGNGNGNENGGGDDGDGVEVGEVPAGVEVVDVVAGPEEEE